MHALNIVKWHTLFKQRKQRFRYWLSYAAVLSPSAHVGWCNALFILLQGLLWNTWWWKSLYIHITFYLQNQEYWLEKLIMCHHLLKIKATQMSVVVHLLFICTRKLKLWNTPWTFVRVYWRGNSWQKKINSSFPLIHFLSMVHFLNFWMLHSLSIPNVHVYWLSLLVMYLYCSVVWMP